MLLSYDVASEEVATEASLHALRTQIAALQTVLADVWDPTNHCFRVCVVGQVSQESLVKEQTLAFLG